ncbi:hypothetical protein ACLKMH_24040 [Psychromonas sp. KJ10-10]|uniref:hypothetical protein n=1 Tax=Psychromonas sp. KJ10-10 TaxID=3391823 RepID=UPI0039B6138F
MKLTKEFKLANVMLASALALAGCGDDPLSNTTTTTDSTDSTSVALSGNACRWLFNGSNSLS